MCDLRLSAFSDCAITCDRLRSSAIICEPGLTFLLQWPTTVTSKPNAHSKLQIAHIKFKSLTANSNRSQQIQIAHSKFKSLTANYKSLTVNYKSLTANSNRSQQIQIAHSKLQIINSARRLRLSTASGATRLKIFVVHEATTL